MAEIRPFGMIKGFIIMHSKSVNGHYIHYHPAQEVTLNRPELVVTAVQQPHVVRRKVYTWKDHKVIAISQVMEQHTMSVVMKFRQTVREDFRDYMEVLGARTDHKTDSEFQSYMMLLGHAFARNTSIAVYL